MIRPCTEADLATVDAIINDDAEPHRGVIPAGGFQSIGTDADPVRLCLVQLSSGKPM